MTILGVHFGATFGRDLSVSLQILCNFNFIFCILQFAQKVRLLRHLGGDGTKI